MNGWTRCGRRPAKAGRIGGAGAPRPRPEVTAPGTKKPRVERREAPLRDRKRSGHASPACRAVSPTAQEAAQASAFLGAPLPSSGALPATTAFPGPLKNTGGGARLLSDVGVGECARTTNSASCAGLTRASMMSFPEKKSYVSPILSHCLMDGQVKPGHDSGEIGGATRNLTPRQPPLPPSPRRRLWNRP